MTEETHAANWNPCPTGVPCSSTWIDHACKLPLGHGDVHQCWVWWTVLGLWILCSSLSSADGHEETP